MISRSEALWLFAMADRVAARLCRHRRECRLEQEDIRQDLLLDLLSRLGAYDPSRGSLQTFVAVCFRHRSVRIGRTAYRERVSRHPVELDAPAVAGGRVIDTLADSDGFAAWVGQPTDRQIELEQRLDLDRMLAALPKDMALLCAALVGDQRCSGTLAGSSRTTRHRRVRKLRDRLAITFAARPHPNRSVAVTLSATTKVPELGK